MNLHPLLQQAIEHAHYAGSSIQAVVERYELHHGVSVDKRMVAQFVKSLPPVCRECSI